MNKMFSDNIRCIDCQNKSYLFQLLSEAEIEMIDKSKTIVNFKKGETIRKQGAALTHVISLSTGLAKVYLEGPKNKNIILAVLKPPSFIGGPGMFVDHKNHFTVTAIADSCVCFIDKGTFKNLLFTNKQFAEEYFKHLGKVTLSAYNRLINLTQKQMSERLADTLIYLSEDIFLSNDFKMVLTNNDMAQLSGMSKDNVVRTLRNFRTEGIIDIAHNRIEILKKEALYEFGKLELGQNTI